jgi:peptidyl-prolyl cis-trans isomerase B (cyclophilin B)
MLALLAAAVLAPSADLPATAAPGAKEPAVGEEVAVLTTDAPEKLGEKAGDGVIIVSFRPDKAPNHVAQFKMLVGKKFYDGVRFHRCIKDFMIQGGDPLSKSLDKFREWGTGGYEENGVEVNVKNEFNDVSHTRGILSTARSADPDSASSQFFIMHKDEPRLDRNYTVFGQVIQGMDVVDAIVNTGDPLRGGAVRAADAVVIKSIEMKTWPLESQSRSR